MEELVFAPLFASNNEYRLLYLDCNSCKNKKNRRNNDNNDNKSLTETIRYMQEKCSCTHKYTPTDCQSNYSKEKEQELENKSCDNNISRNAVNTSLVFVLRNGKQLVAHDDHCTHVVKRLEYSNNLLITLSDAKCDEYKKTLTKEDDEIEHMECTVNTDNTEVKQEHQEQLHSVYRIVSQVNSIYSCTRLSDEWNGVADNSNNSVQKRQNTRWRCFVYHILRHCLVTIEEIQTIMMTMMINMSMCETDNKDDNTIDYSCTDQTSTLPQNLLPSNLLLEEESENNIITTHKENHHPYHCHHDYCQTSDNTEVPSAKKHKVDWIDGAVSKNYFLESLHTLQKGRETSHYKHKQMKEWQTKFDTYTFHELIKKVPCSPQELAHTLIDMGAITCGKNSYIYLIQPAELYTALHSTIKMFESILLRETWSIHANTEVNGNHYSSNNKTKESEEDECRNEAVWKSIIEELCPELYPEIVIRAIQSIYSSSLHKDGKQNTINTTTQIQQRQVEIDHSKKNECLVVEELPCTSATSHVTNVDREDVCITNDYQRHSLYFSRCFDVLMTVIGLSGYVFYASPVAQHNTLQDVDIEVITLHASQFWRELLKIMPPWLQHAVVILMMTQDAPLSNYESTLPNSPFDANVAHNVGKNINENENNYQQLCAYILDILQEYVIVLEDTNTVNNSNNYNSMNDIYNQYTSDAYCEINKEGELDNTGKESSSSLFSDINTWYEVIWLPAYTLPTQMEQRVKALAQVKRSPWRLEELTTYLAPVLLSEDKF